jgi:hypothetical protein
VFTIIGGTILVLEFPLLLLGAFGYGGIVYSQGLAAALYMLSPSPLAALTMIGALHGKKIDTASKIRHKDAKTLSHKFHSCLFVP